ncbi:type I-E CRISPR-associated protein Cas6/Cse3/CasE [Pseudoflavonifractor sp. MSJ-37]|uniref:type I-E CRISPR-associated protein Cas6/Cse3/CasE n=1 Tax=Pseudoflavonifractor sp. MSJ-37 TaxID=2841531 RepID=UPI001C0FD703|nr:type I-E CRISPR-associated protein Cas6/Cse3/CasE [Pseudoflavonifractor sp. MSJ-37]MBU5434217.1 type I-E CRISPR-associated protein Cas6/Cse3/CasE [Pseudoflavonifractor sp. MSJ-37]
MYLTQLHLDGGSRRTLTALSSPNKFHGAVENAFQGPRKRNLWRIDHRNGQDYLLLLSEEVPDLTEAADQFAPPGETWQTREYGPLLDRVRAGSRWQFRLCASPTYSVPAGPGKRGRVCAHSTTEHQIQWLLEQSEKHGFSLERDDFTVTKVKWYRFRKGTTGHQVTFLAVTYDGTLEVRDPDRFREMLCGGIGRGKAYGAGLMTIVHRGEADG